MLKKTFAVLGTLALALTLASCGGKSDEQLKEEGWVKDPANNGYVEVKDVPASPVDSSKTKEDKTACKVGDFGNECASVNKENLIDYMGREDIVYIDLRGLDEGYTSGHIKGFEPVSFFHYLWGDGEQLFTKANEARYTQSVAILNNYFPKDKTLFLMCQGGARVETMMALLDSQDYDMSKVYNVSGYKQLSDASSSVKDLVVKSGANVPTVEYFPKDKEGKLVGLTPITK